MPPAEQLSVTGAPVNDPTSDTVDEFELIKDDPIEETFEEAPNHN